MTVPVLTLPTENGQVHIYINASFAGLNTPPARDAAIGTAPRRRPLLLTIGALALFGGGYALRASTSTPAAADILASRSGTLQFAMPQPPLPNEMPPALRLTPPRPYDNPSFASGPLPVPVPAAPSAVTPGAPGPSATPALPPAAAPAANPFGLR